MRRKLQEQERRKVQVKKSSEPQSVKRNAPKSAPLSVRFDNVSKPSTRPGVDHVAASVLSEKNDSQDLTYQSTLLHMRVVGMDCM